MALIDLQVLRPSSVAQAAAAASNVSCQTDDIRSSFAGHLATWAKDNYSKQRC